MGVVCSFDPVTGAHGPAYREAREADGIALVEWAKNNELAASDVELIRTVLNRGQQEHRDLVEVEVSVEHGKVRVGSVRKADRTATAAVRGAVALTAVDDLGLTRREAVALVEPADVEQLLHSTFATTGAAASAVVATGLAASPGVAVGAVYFSADDAFEAFMAGQEVILVCQETSPADIHGMEIANGILTSKGGLASHAAVVARGWGIPAVVGVSALELDGKSFRVGSVEVVEGDVISLDGSSGDLRVGQADVAGSEAPPELLTILEWADEIRGDRAKIRANADNANDAAKARQFGAEGIGLCRTEHMFLGERLPTIQKMIVATTTEEELAALDELGRLQRIDFVELLEAMDGLPVTVRLLDPPLHEFLPTLAEMAQAESGSGDAESDRLHAAALDWQEANPMLGTRGVRLAVLKPALYKMQTNALAHAVLERSKAGGSPQAEIMIPLVVDRSEIELARSWIEGELDAVLGQTDLRSSIQIGAMIETPRAALQSEQMTAVSDFFSFGTNDLTQMTFGFSRDDIESRLMARYLEQGLLKSNPFHSLDEVGVGALVKLAVDGCRKAAGWSNVKLGACGEHGGEPESISFLLGLGIDYVSCSPFRVPVARLAAAKYFLTVDG